MKVYFLLILTSVILASGYPDTHQGMKISKRFISLKMDNSMTIKEFKHTINASKLSDIEDIKEVNNRIFIVKFKSDFKKDTFKNYNILPSYTLDDNKWPNVADNQIIIAFKKDLKIDKENFIKSHSYEVLHNFIHNKNAYLIRTNKNIFAELEKLNKTGYFEYTQVDFYMHHVLHFRPNDSLYNDQWHLKTSPGVNAEAAWDITRGSAGIKISIVDNGMDLNHEDLSITKHRDFSRTVEDFNDGGEHGTACAGVSAGKGNNSLGVTGLCMNCSVLAAKIMHTSGYGLSSADSRALEWSANVWGADVINNSWGYSQDFDLYTNNRSLYDAIHYAATVGRGGKGSVVVFASGNEYRRFADYSLGGHPDIINVGAVDDRGYRSEYSNFGNKLFVVAPSNGGSEAITTTDITGVKGYTYGNYTSDFGGTSSAAPLVSGLIGLILSKNSSLTLAQVKEVLKETSDKIVVREVSYLPQESKCVGLTGADYGADGHSICTGYGRVNAKRALEYVRDHMGGGSCTPNPAGEICDNSIDDDCDGATDDNDEDCKEDNQCVGVDCPVNSHCSLDNSGEPGCFCNEGYKVNSAGDSCIKVTCEDLACGNNSTCQEKNGVKQCVCDNGYKYDSVTRSCKSNLCDNSSCQSWQKCNPQTGKCESKSGFCEFDYECGSAFKCKMDTHKCYNPCDEVTCSNHGTCINNNGSLSCNCDAGYQAQGLACVKGNSCDGIDCSGHGTCVNNNGSVSCNCNLGYQAQGLACVKGNSCDGIDCSGHGTCGKDNYGLYCDCEKGYYEINLECKKENYNSGSSSSCAYSDDNKLFIFVFMAFLSILIIRRKYN